MCPWSLLVTAALIGQGGGVCQGDGEGELVFPSQNFSIYLFLSFLLRTSLAKTSPEFVFFSQLDTQRVPS